MKYVIVILIILMGIKIYALSVKEKIQKELSLGDSVKGSKSYFYNEDKTKIIYSYMGKTFLLGKNEVKNIDIDSFIPIDNEYASDVNNVYWKIFPIKGVIKNSFQVLGEDYAKDEKNVFFEQNEIPEADTQTFRLGGRFQAEDNKYCYTHGKIEYTKVDKHWSFNYTESIDIKIELLSRKVSKSTDDIQVLQDRKHLQELLNKQEALLEVIERVDNNKEVSSLFYDFSLEEVIVKLKNNKSMDNSEKYAFIATLYRLEEIINKKDNKKIGYFLKKSIDSKFEDENVYAYALWLFSQKEDASIDYFKKLLATKYREKSLIKLSTIAFRKKKTKEAFEYYAKVNVSKIIEINTKKNYIELLEKIVVLDIKKKKFENAAKNLNNVLAFYEGVASSNPYLFEELGSVYKQFFIIYDGLNNKEKKDESFEKSMLIYSSLNKAFPSKFFAEIKQLKALKKELGE